MDEGTIAVEDPRGEDVSDLVQRHLAFARAMSKPEDVHALDLGALLDPAVTFFGFRRQGRLVAIGALKVLDEHHGELKSMHTVAAMRGRGIGRAMVDHVVGAARTRGLHRVSLETGAEPAFAPARALYASAGFVPCGPFADYHPSEASVFMTLVLEVRGSGS